MTHNKNNLSFTLIELLVVLALVAILSVVVVITLNPAELIKQARDSNRLSDLATINTALNLFSTDVTSGFMGTSTVVYVSIPDNASSTCGSLGLPTLPSGYVYNCVTSANLRNTDGTGWIPVNFQRISSNSPISQLPVDPINTTTTFNYYIYITGGSWKLSAALEAQKNISVAQTDGGTSGSSFEIGNNIKLGGNVFPSGYWIKVPGDPRFGTSDFWVMKYEAKCSDINGNLLRSPSVSFATYSDDTAPCTSANFKYIISDPLGAPIGDIEHTLAGSNNDAREYCQNIGAHLITNNEWQTIAWNIQNNATNWSGGTIGSGSINIGNQTFLSMQAIDALTGTSYRIHTLSNGNTIWDFSGNLWEWTNDTITGTNEPYNAVAGWSWKQFTDITNWGTLTQQVIGPSNATWNSTHGMGKIYTKDGTADATIYGFSRGGGSFPSGILGGLEALDLSAAYQYGRSYVGIRCVR